ncbi:hypothetical protein FXO38_09964 [Capsicum annuum]|nr:hypothetical protein FXO38_09964 [Capsicum annuum]KAF3669283.1 hypothetical protein FXO37_09111 [Capsicum annuum]
MLLWRASETVDRNDGFDIGFLFDGSLASVLVGWSLGLAILCARDCVVASIIPQRDFSSLRNRGWSGWLDRVRVELTCDGPFSSVA